MSPTLQERKRDVVLQPEDAGARHAYAEALLGEGDTAAAIAQLQKGLTIDGTRAASRLLLARAYARDQRLSDARQLLEESARLFPDEVELRDELVELYLTAHRLDDALVHTAELTRLRPAEARRWSRHGVLLAHHHLWDSAHSALHKAADLAPDDTGIAGDFALVARERAQAAGDAGQSDVRSSREVLEAAGLPTDGSAASRAAALLSAQDRHAAKRVLVTAAAAERGTAAYWFVKAELSASEADWPRAEQALRRTCELHPSWAPALRRLAEAALAQGHLDDARSACRAALKSAPGDLALRAQLQRIETRANEVVVPERTTRLAALYWSVVGGGVSPLQAVAIPGKGELFISGHVGPVIRESAQLAFSFIRARAADLGVGDLVPGKDIHLHLVDTQTEKDGASAGLAFTLACVSALRDRALPDGLACTGEITLEGHVRAIAGLREKVIAAYLSGYRTVLLPRRNLRDAQDLPPEVTSRLELVYVDSILEACRLLFAE